MSDNVSDDDISMMDFKSSIVEAISNNIIEERLDFRTVDFRYSNLANEIFNDANTIKELPNYSMIKTIKCKDDELECTVGIFNCSGRIIACKTDISGFHYIDHNDFLDLINSHLESDNYIGDIDYNTIKSLCNTIRTQNAIYNSMGDNQRKFYIVIDKMQDNLEYMLDAQEINDIEFARLSMLLETIKYNIMCGYINNYLSKVYNDMLIEKLKSCDMTTKYQINYLVNELLPVKFHSKLDFNSDAIKFKIISIIQFVR